MAVLITEDKSITLVNVVGEIDIETLAELGGKFNIPDIESKRKIRSEKLMQANKKIFIALMFFALAFTALVPHASAKTNEFDAVCGHLKTKYRAKKLSIPFMWMARAVVGIARPAGVKSFKMTVFRGLQFAPESLNDEMKTVMRDAFSPDWSPILRVRSKNGSQVYMNMREEKNDIKIFLVTIQNDEATVIRAKFDPDKLTDFINNPKFSEFLSMTLTNRKKIHRNS